VRDDQTSLLLAALGVAIGVGCVVAAYLDRPARRARFIPIGAGGLAVGFGLLGVAPASFAVTLALLVATGLVAGLYIIPLQAMLQSLAPDDLRGRVLGTANGYSFLMGAIGSGLFFALRQADMPSNRIFLVLGGLCAVVGAVIVLWLRGRGEARAA
jgi:MFS family permease